MNLFGLTISRSKTLASRVAVLESAIEKALPQLNSVNDTSNRGWYPIIREPFAGAWQMNEEITVQNVTTHPIVWACVTLTASDIAKMRIRLVQQDDDNIWNPVDVAAFSPVLRKPNHYQNRIQFYEHWIISKQLNGNAYVLKMRDGRGNVVRMYVLDPARVRPLVAPDGSVYYELSRDDISQLPQTNGVIVPASEIIHDRFNTLFHPLVGISPIYAAGLSAVQGINMQNTSTLLFGNGANPGGVLTAPGAIKDETAGRIKAYWDQNFTGDNVGKVAVLGDGLKYEPMVMKFVDAQVIEQLKWTGEQICSAFHVPAYMVGAGPMPNYNNIEALNQQYYSQCLQKLAEDIELCLDEGLGLTDGDVAAKRYGTEFDTDDLLRMDTSTLLQTLRDGVGYYTPNEGRQKLNLRPIVGGDTVYRQQQDFSIEALNRRDEQAAAPGTDADTATDPAAGATTPEPEPEKSFTALRAEAREKAMQAFQRPAA